MNNNLKFYIDGKWIDPVAPTIVDVINPATEQPFSQLAMGNEKDVDKAVVAARAAFGTYSKTSVEERIALLESIIAEYEKRIDDLGEAISSEMGAPLKMAKGAHCRLGLRHFSVALDVLKSFDFEEDIGEARIVKDPIGVCGFITPWNWPLNQIVGKVAPALATGCTIILKPSEMAPLNGIIFAEIMDAAGVPSGVFNLINGDGPGVGTALSSHPDIDMVSFTGSTRAGIEVAKNAAPTVKRVTQELGGKSANIILDDADFDTAITRDVIAMCANSGQSCNAPSRMLVPNTRMAEAANIAKTAADKIQVGDPRTEGTQIGPVASATQYEKIQNLIQAGIDEGATLETGGVGRPGGLNTGYYIKPTIFSSVKNDMKIAQEEIFGPVLCLIGYDDDDDAIRIANDTPYGLFSYISSSNPERAKRVARQMRSGGVKLNGAGTNGTAPFGGYKRSGNGREHGKYGFDEYLEMKSILGYNSSN